ncbi:hypothetical protein [Austwickia sp. TVS 96-490-7B]|uniref:hypothetical protein n=1 Tax=Austwickia sp. TVS 96-490-7B TaxID=2830843 RepID=UPI001C58AC51|nr:hypothetical protein [Austwickia sp. TVS 96-490-7B]
MSKTSQAILAQSAAYGIDEECTIGVLPAASGGPPAHRESIHRRVGSAHAPLVTIGQPPSVVSMNQYDTGPAKASMEDMLVS